MVKRWLARNGEVAAPTAPRNRCGGAGAGQLRCDRGYRGLMAGSYLYAETSDYLSATIQKIGNRGGIMLPDLLRMRLVVFLVIFMPVLVLSLVGLERLT